MGNSFLTTLIVTCALTLAGAANAQEPTSIEAARTMIDEAELGDVFEPVAHDSLISARHIASRMICHFSTTDTRSELAVFSTLPRGEDVGCVSDRPDQATTLYATRYNPPMSAEQGLAEAVAGIRHRFADAQPTPALLTMQSESLPRPHVAHFFVTIRGERWISSALVARSGDWVIKLRYSARCIEDDAIMRHQLEAGAIFQLALMEIQR